MIYKAKHTKTIIMLAAILTIAGLLESCLSEKNTECDVETLLTVKVDEAQWNMGRSATDQETEVAAALMYVFNSNAKLDRVIEVSSEDILNETPIPISYPYGCPPDVVVWGNIDNTVEISGVASGSLLDDARLMLVVNDDVAQSPGRLYHVIKRLTAQSRQQIIISPAVGRIVVTVRGVADFAYNAGDYFFTLATPFGGYDFRAVAQTNSLIHTSDGVMSANQNDFVTAEPVNMVPHTLSGGSQEAVTVSFYERSVTGNLLLVQVSEAYDGEPIVPYAGSTTNVLIDLSAGETEVTVKVEVTDWNMTTEWLEW